MLFQKLLLPLQKTKQMIEKIKALDIEKLIFFDIEIATANKELVPDSIEYGLFEHANRDKVTGDYLEEPALQALYKRTGALSPIFGKVVVISVGFISKGIIYIKHLKGDEATIIESFYKLLKTGYILAAYNGIQFDLPFLRIRAQKHNLQHLIPSNIDDSSCKEWNVTEKKYKVNFVELMNMFKGTMYRNMSLDSACYINGIESPKDGEVTGHNVSKAFYNGKLDKIAEYCGRDVVASINLFLKMTSRPIIEGVVFKSKKEKIELVEPSVLELLYTEKSFNKNIKTKIKEHISKVKMTRKDWLYVETCLYSLYINTKIMHKDADNKVNLEKKKLEISKFIKEIK